MGQSACLRNRKSQVQSLSSSLMGTRLASPAPKPTNGRLQSWGSIPHVSTKPPGRQVGRRWSAKPTIRGFDSHPGVQLLQRSLMAKPQAHNLVIVGSSPIAATKHRWCNGNITVSKTVVQGSNPCLCVRGAVGKLVKPQDFQACVCGFNSRRHCQRRHRSARLSAWATVCKTAASCVAGATPA